MFDKVDGVVLGFINFTSFLSLMVKFGFFGTLYGNSGGFGFLSVLVWLLICHPIGPLVLWARFPFLPACQCTYFPYLS